VTNSGWLGRTFKEIASVCNDNIKQSLNIKFSEDYREQKHKSLPKRVNMKK
jgi:hypothetical protein